MLFLDFAIPLSWTKITIPLNFGKLLGPPRKQFHRSGALWLPTPGQEGPRCFCWFLLWSLLWEGSCGCHMESLLLWGHVKRQLEVTTQGWRVLPTQPYIGQSLNTQVVHVWVRKLWNNFSPWQQLPIVMGKKLSKNILENSKKETHQ